jgi:plastocyanin
MLLSPSSSFLLLATLSYIPSILCILHNVNVGGNQQLLFTPSTVRALPGDVVQFTFLDLNHTVTSGNPFGGGCTPSNVFNSGFIPVSNQTAATAKPTFSVVITNTLPMVVYCAQLQHCQNGMVMVINPSLDVRPLSYSTSMAL